MKRSYYLASVGKFLADSGDAILGALVASHPHELDFLQRNAWMDQIQLFRQLLEKKGSDVPPLFNGPLTSG